MKIEKSQDIDLRDVATILARTPKILDALLAGLPADWVRRNDGPGTWSAYDIVGHLLHCDDANWLSRIRMILHHGSERSFEPFDREAMLRWTPEPVDTLLGRLQAVRQASLDELRSFDLHSDDLQRHGWHPVLGDVTLGQLLATWVAHDLTHIAQAAEVLARRYRSAVGGWRAYLPALDRVAEAE